MTAPRRRRGRLLGVLLAAAAALPACAADPPLELPPVRTADPAASAPGALSLEEAVSLALLHNPSLLAERTGPPLAGTFAAIERAVFDPVLFAEASYGEDNVEQVSRATGERFSVVGQDESGTIGLRQRLPTGSDLELSFRQGRTISNRTPEQVLGRAGLSLTQALLQGASIDANLVALRQARLAVLESDYQLRGFAETLVAEVEQAWWEALLARRSLSIFENALELARRQGDEARERVRIGTVPRTELHAIDAELARRRQDLIDARSAVTRRCTALLRLLGVGRSGRWVSCPDLQFPPQAAVAETAPLAAHLELARRHRPELNEARLALERGDLALVQTRNGLLPRLDLFVNLGRTGFADSFAAANRRIDGETYDLQAGVSLEYPLGNRAARARHEGAALTRLQRRAALDNLAALVDADVRLAVAEVERSAAQIDATAATLGLQREVLRAEQAKFGVGRSTAVLVAQAQRDLLQSEIDALQAQTTHRQALVELFRLTGTLLLRRGIAAPGASMDRVPP